MATAAAATFPVEKKLDMSLDEIVEDRKAQQASVQHNEGNSGRSKNTKRADRLAQTGTDDDEDMDGDADEGSGRRVYVGNLSWSVKWQDLKDHMRAAGQVEHASIMESSGRSKGCGLVTYATEAEALHAIATLNDTEIDGRKIFVREDREGSKAATASARGHKGTRVYVGNLSWNVKWQDLKDHMKQVGQVIHADVLEEPNGRSKGCGLVEYATPEEALAAINTLNDTEIDGRKIFVREDRQPDGGSISSLAKRAPRNNSNAARANHTAPAANGTHTSNPQSLYVGNLPWDVNWQSLKDLFRAVGDVERAEVAQFPDGRSRGFGIIRYANAEHAREAIETLNGAELNGRVIEVRYDKAR